jgi:uncharacterized protein GlcG (DUF336 family)
MANLYSVPSSTENAKKAAAAAHAEARRNGWTMASALRYSTSSRYSVPA